MTLCSACFSCGDSASFFPLFVRKFDRNCFTMVACSVYVSESERVLPLLCSPPSLDAFSTLHTCVKVAREGVILERQFRRSDFSDFVLFRPKKGGRGVMCHAPI